MIINEFVQSSIHEKNRSIELENLLVYYQNQLANTIQNHVMFSNYSN